MPIEILKLRTESEVLESYLKNLNDRAVVYDITARKHPDRDCQIKLEGKAESLFELIDDLEEKHIYPQQKNPNILGGNSMTQPQNQFQDLVQDPWRQLEEPDQQDFAEWASIKMQERAIFGEKKYQSKLMGFQGDPLNQLTQEAFDSLFYAWMAEREREYLLERIAELEHDNKRFERMVRQGIELRAKQQEIEKSLYGTIEGQQVTIVAWEATDDSSKLEVDLLRNRLENSENYNQGMEDTVKELRETISTMDDGIAEQFVEISGLVDRIKDLDGEVTTLGDELAETRSEVESLNDQLAESNPE